MLAIAVARTPGELPDVLFEAVARLAGVAIADMSTDDKRNLSDVLRGMSRNVNLLKRFAAKIYQYGDIGQWIQTFRVGSRMATLSV